MKLNIFSIICLVAISSLLVLNLDYCDAHKKKHGHVKIKVWRGPSHGHKKHKYAPFGYHFSVDEKGHY